MLRSVRAAAHRKRIARDGMSESKSARYYTYNLIFSYRFANGNTGTERCANGDTGKFIKKQEAYIVANSKYNKRRWSVPSKRAKGYAADRKAKVHTYGPKEGKELTDFEAGIRSGYLQAQSDHAGMYKYKKALDEGKSKKEARDISQARGKK